MTATLNEKTDLFSTLFAGVFPGKKIINPIRLIELFGGVGSQARALENLQVPFEHWRLVEWSDKSCIQYNAIHQRDFKDYSEGKTREEMEARVLGVSLDYNSPLPKEKLAKKPLDWLKSLYNASVATNNLFDISKVRGEDLGIIEAERFEYLLTYSFPCQDLSNAGKMAGLAKGSGTRSGLLWQVERILDELKGSGKPLPQTLLMENVPGLVGEEFYPHFLQWADKLEKLGYKNFIKILDASDFGIPQTRKRCFMVSLLGDFSYDFPAPIKLEYCLKDFLEAKVDKSYFLTEERIKRILAWNSRKNPLDGIEGEKKICPTLLARDRISPATIFEIKQIGNILPDKDGFKNRTSGRVYSADGALCPTLSTSDGGNKQPFIAKPNLLNKKVDGKEPKIQDRVYGTEAVGPALTTSFPPNYLVDLSIRKLTETEYCRLMGFTDEDCLRFKERGISKSSIYRCMGDSIVVTCLMSIFGQMLMCDEKRIELTRKAIERARKWEP